MMLRYDLLAEDRVQTHVLLLHFKTRDIHSGAVAFVEAAKSLLKLLHREAVGKQWTGSGRCVMLKAKVNPN